VLGDDTTDQGTDMRVGMKYWQTIGVLDAAGGRHKDRRLRVDQPKDPAELWEACWLFSAVAIGFEFQQAQDDQFASAPGTMWLGHRSSVGIACRRSGATRSGSDRLWADISGSLKPPI